MSRLEYTDRVTEEWIESDRISENQRKAKADADNYIAVTFGVKVEEPIKEIKVENCLVCGNSTYTGVCRRCEIKLLEELRPHPFGFGPRE